MTLASNRAAVAEQARSVAAAWSPPGAPSSWQLTCAQFRTLADDDELLGLAATIEPERLPPLLFEAAATSLVLQREPQPLRSWFPRLGEPQPALPPRFAQEYRDFCLDHREELLAVCSQHRYQMNEVGRSAHVVPALGPAAGDGRGVALVDIGTGAGLGLHLDRYRYTYRGPGDRVASVGDPGSPLTIGTNVRGALPPPLPAVLPEIVERVGIDTEPLNLSDAAVRSWLAACIPQEIGAVTRWHRALEVARDHPARTVRGAASDVLLDVLANVPRDLLICLVDSFVHVFFSSEELEHFRGLVEHVGSQRDLDWVSIDPLVPMGRTASRSVVGLPVPAALIERNRREGVFGVLGRLSYRGGRREGALLAVTHPSAAWIQWLRGTLARTTHEVAVPAVDPER